MAVCALVVTSIAQSTWKLSTNVLLTSNEISFNQGSNGVWYFMQSSSSKHDPKTYKFLSEYSAPCNSNPIEVLIPGVDCWLNSKLDPVGNNLPLVGVNFTYHTPVQQQFRDSTAVGVDAPWLFRRACHSCLEKPDYRHSDCFWVLQ
jgi:hypothetical protein